MRRHAPHRPLLEALHSGRWALLVGLLCLLAQGLTALHFAIVDHTHCVEHGGWAHVAPHEHEELAFARSTEAVQVPSSEHAHEDCPFISRAVLIAVSAAECSTLFAVGLAAVALGSSLNLPAVRLWLLAPKTSPPC